MLTSYTDAPHEGHDLETQVLISTKSITAIILESSLLIRHISLCDNRSYLERNHIRFSGKQLGRPPKSTPKNKDELMLLEAQRRQEYRERIPIEKVWLSVQQYSNQAH